MPLTKKTIVIFFLFHCLSFQLPKTCEQAIPLFKGTYHCISTPGTNIGKGANAIAFAVALNNQSQQYVLKVSKLKEDEDLEKSRNFIFINKLQNTQYVIQRHLLKQQGSILYEILDFGSLGSLDKYLKGKNLILMQRENLQLFRKIVEGVMNIHKKNIVHADLKLDNIVVTEGPSPLIIDFDLSVENREIASNRGTRNYMDPAILDNWGKGKFIFTPNVDKWSLGVILYLMTQGQSPFNAKLNQFEIKQILSIIRRGNISFQIGTSEEIIDIILKLLRINPNERIEFEDLLRLIDEALESYSWTYLNQQKDTNINNSLEEKYLTAVDYSANSRATADKRKDNNGFNLKLDSSDEVINKFRKTINNVVLGNSQKGGQENGEISWKTFLAIFGSIAGFGLLICFFALRKKEEEIVNKDNDSGIDETDMVKV